ncbi:DUF934 domain-containing protein [Glaciimonas sp. PCH181]|uniref:DUF934 domain-containing protein n=1 Tax=Glaciimonas sp. PCH181 TaxID=2133943 RepID=UPI000D33BC67|nr:DUF934 domain-containing protein [Glaciimonas sp. PCH181]PUA19311.1 oxidoreductase [Glaciimonas sp. PCH181]
MANIIKIINGMPQVIDDNWIVISEVDAATQSPGTHHILPFSYWQKRDVYEVTIKPRALWISPDHDFEASVTQLHELDLIAVDFPSFRDGRGYSIAYLLRSRYGWKGELRAIGDVLRDQLNYMRRCGFDAFAIRSDKNIHDALKSFSRYSVQYQGAVDQPLPLFRRR